MGIYKKLLELQKELTVMPKTAKGGSDKSPYKYTSGDYLFSVLRPKMDILGLMLFQEIVESKSEHVMWKLSYGDKQQTYVSATFKFTWVDADTDEKVEHLFHADGFNDWDKAIGSAMTYAERYYILKQFHIPTSELDPDARKENSVQTIQPVNKEPKKPEAKIELANDTQLDQIRTLAKQKGAVLSNIPKHYGVAGLPKLTFVMAKDCIEQLKLRKDI